MEPLSFFEVVIDAGAILSGFCGTFLSFRIQREANYYRQPVTNYADDGAKDVYVGLAHFTSSFFLLTLATLCCMVFGFVVPLAALAGSVWALEQMRLVVAGLISTLILLVAYFVDELVHYQILKGRLISDAREWKGEIFIVLVAIVLVVATCIAVYAQM